MAIRPKINYPGKTDATDPNYPEGKAQNVTAPGDGTGTPWEEALVNDIFGFQQKLLAESGIAPSGNADNIAASDYFDSLLTLFAGPIKGLVPVNAADTQHDITIGAGRALDTTEAYLLQLTATLTKQIDAAWAAGDNAGGLFNGAVAASTTYYVYIIRKDSDGTIDAGFDTSAVAANIPVGYTAYRRVGYAITDSGSNILNYTVTEVAGGSLEYEWDAVQNSLNEIATIAARTLVTLAVPPETIALVSIHLGWSAGTVRTWVAPSSFTDIAPAAINQDLMVTSAGAVNDTFKRVRADSSSQVAHRSSVVTGLLTVGARGYIDQRAA